MLIKCEECGKEMSGTAKACPHCGHRPAKNNSAQYKIIGSAMFVWGLLAFTQSWVYGSLFVCAGLGVFIYGRMLD